MLKTSRWIFHINNMFMKEDLTAQINVDENGEYKFYAVTKKGLRPLSDTFGGELKIDGDTISIQIANPEMPKMKIEVAVTFGEDTAEGYFKLPILGKMKFPGERIEMTDLPVLDEEITEEDAKEKLEEE